MVNKRDLRVALYCRVANEDALALELQEQQVLQALRAEGYAHFSFYSDNGFGGLTFDRPAFQKLLADLRAGYVQAVAVKDTSRIGRNYGLVHAFIDKQLDEGKKLISVIEPYDNSIAKALRKCFEAKQVKNARTKK